MKLKAGAVIELIDKHHGNLSVVSRALHVSRQTVYKFLSTHPTVQDALDEARERMIDNVESALYNQALGDNVTAQIFFLKTQGKKRGYVERQEHELSGPDGKPIRVTTVEIEKDRGDNGTI